MPTETVTADEFEAWRGFIGRSEVRRQVLDADLLRRYAVAVGSDIDVERVLPPLAHWAYFLEIAATDSLGPDGHPKRGVGLMPPIRLPRRMFASATMQFIEPLTLGQPAELTLTLADVKHRSGKTGDLVFVELDRTLTQDGRMRLTERQTIVYRDVGEPTPAVAPVELPARDGQQLWTPGTVELFRFSAVTFNSHRIHYDLPYVTGEEGYPGLVVHGPLTAARLFAFAQSLAGRPLQTFSFRASSPLFAGQPVRLCPGANPGQVEAIRCDGAVAMSANTG